MKHFASLFNQLDQTNKTSERVSLLQGYFASAPEEDRIWALALFTGRRPRVYFKSRLIQNWAMELAGIPEWLFFECYSSVGDQAETISLILPAVLGGSNRSLDDWFRTLSSFKNAADEEKKKFITHAWSQMTRYEIFVFNKLLMGSFRVGVSQTLVIRALAAAFSLEPAVIAHRVMGDWDPFQTNFHDLIRNSGDGVELSKPYPFFLAYAIEGEPDVLGPEREWYAEWKWDGIRSQIILRNGQFFIWSRGEELITDKFPELHALKSYIPDGTVLDGEIVCFTGQRPMPFNVLQTRIGRKNLTKKILADAPAAFICYDILEVEGRDIRDQSHESRRQQLERIYAREQLPEVFRLSGLVRFDTWKELKDLHKEARQNAAEGFMLKRKSAPYQVGRKKGDWWKWKIEPLSIDAVLVYAQKGHGRRTELFTDYTFAVWENDKLIPFAKAYSGLTNEEIKKVDRFVKQNTLEKFGPVRTVLPKLVFEIGFEGISRSSRHKSGVAVRFPRILRWRTDKPAEEADTLNNLNEILNQFG